MTILARMGNETYRDADVRVGELLDRQIPKVEREMLVVDNSLAADHEVRMDQRVTLIGGDNSSWEFSAFEKALDYLGDRAETFDFVHLVTSAFDTLYTAYLERFTSPLLQRARGRAICLGHIDCYNRPVSAYGFRSQHWVRSCFLFVDPATVKAMRSLTSVTASEDLFSGDPERPFRSTAPISLNYQDYLIDWLTGNDVGQGVRWHSRCQLSIAGLPRFEAKVRAILNEHLLSIRLRALGCPVVDVTWLSGVLRNDPLGEVEWYTGWRRQLADRDRDRVLVA